MSADIKLYCKQWWEVNITEEDDVSRGDNTKMGHQGGRGSHYGRYCVLQTPSLRAEAYVIVS